MSTVKQRNRKRGLVVVALLMLGVIVAVFAPKIMQGRRDAADRRALAGLLLDKDADLNAADAFGWTPLHYAAELGLPDIAEELLLRGVAVNARDENGMTPLHWAAFEGHVDVVQVLLAHGADPDAQGKRFGWTPLFHALMAEHQDVARVLVATGADVNATADGQETPLSLAQSSGLPEMVELLKKHGAEESE